MTIGNFQPLQKSRSTSYVSISLRNQEIWNGLDDQHSVLLDICMVRQGKLFAHVFGKAKLSQEVALAVVTPQSPERCKLNGAPDFLDILRQLLQDERYNVTTTNFVPKSFAMIVAAQPELLIVDLVHGEAAGWNLLREIRSTDTTRHIPLVLVSTSIRLLDEAKEERVASGNETYLVKPFDLDDLLQAVESMIGTA